MKDKELVDKIVGIPGFNGRSFCAITHSALINTF